MVALNNITFDLPCIYNAVYIKSDGQLFLKQTLQVY